MLPRLVDWFYKVLEKIIHIWVGWFLFLILFWYVKPFVAWLFIFGWGFKKLRKR